MAERDPAFFGENIHWKILSLKNIYQIMKVSKKGQIDKRKFGDYFYEVKRMKRYKDFTKSLQHVVNDLNYKFKKNPSHVDERVFFQTEKLYILYDAFPKSKYHLLIVPKNTKIQRFNDLKSKHINLVQECINVGKEIIQHLKEIEKDKNMKFRLGYHAIPSLVIIHMHIISNDYSRHHMKKTVHWNSFTTDFLIPPKEFLFQLEENGKVEIDVEKYKKIKYSKVVKCPKTKETFKNVAAAKVHWVTLNKFRNVQIEKSKKYKIK